MTWCLSLGILVENKSPREVIKEVGEGKYDREISEEITETPKEKKEKIDAYFAKVLAEQERIRQQEEAAKAAAEAAAATPGAVKEGEELVSKEKPAETKAVPEKKPEKAVKEKK